MASKSAEQRHDYHIRNRESICAKSKAWYWNNYDRAIAARRKYHRENIEKNRIQCRQYARLHRADGNRRNRAYSRRLRVAVLAGYGNKCCQCGFSDDRALQIDHVYGGGARERQGGLKGGTFLLRLINGNFPTEYQLLCANCNQLKSFSNLERPRHDASRARGWKARERAYYHERRIVILAAYGNACAQCGFAKKDALHIDHIRGGGSRELKEKFKRNSHQFLRWLIVNGFPPQYQLLCANCNWIKRCERGEQPTGRRSITT